MLTSNAYRWVYMDPRVALQKPTKSEAPAAHVLDVERLARTCLNCGAQMQDQRCRLACTCGYYASCTDII